MTTGSITSEIFNHRGRGQGHPEGTILSLRDALSSGAAGLALDIRLTRDLRWIVPKKTDSGTISRIHAAQYSQCRSIALDLDAILALFATFGVGKTLILDMRDKGEQRSLVALIERHGLGSSVVVTAWCAEQLAALHDLAPTIRLGLCLPEPACDKLEVHAVLRRGKTRLVYDPSVRFDGWLGIRPSERLLPKLPLLPLFAILAPALLCGHRTVSAAREKGAIVIAFGVNRIAAGFLQRNGISQFISDSL